MPFQSQNVPCTQGFSLIECPCNDFKIFCPWVSLMPFHTLKEPKNLSLQRNPSYLETMKNGLDATEILVSEVKWNYHKCMDDRSMYEDGRT